jgi:hypothetical protein
MEQWAQWGAFLVSGGTSVALPSPAEQLVRTDTEAQPPLQFSTSDRQACDALFQAHAAADPGSLARVALVVAAGTLALKAIVVDESGLFLDKPTQPQRCPRPHQQGAAGQDDDLTPEAQPAS